MPIGDRLEARPETIARQIVDAAFAIHSELGAGLLESIYVSCLVYELEKRGLRVEREVRVPIYYDGREMSDPLRLDVLVEGCVIVEVKAVVTMHPVFKAQLLTYLKLTKLQLGFLINFNVALIKDGIERVVRF